MTKAVTSTSSPSLVLRRAFIWLAHLLVLVTPFAFTWVNEELFEFNKMIFVYGVTMMMTGLWLGMRVLDKHWRWPLSFLTFPLVAFLVSQVLSTAFSIHPYTSWFGYYTRFHGGLLSSLTYAIVFWLLVTELKANELKRLLWTFLIAALGSAVYSLPESIGHSPSCWLISGGVRFDVSCWKQDVQSRIFGTFGQPNWLAAYMVMVAPIAAGLSITSRKIGQKIALLILLVATILVVYLTHSRSGALALGSMLICGIFLWTMHLWQSQRRLLAASIMLTLMGAILLLGSTSFGQRLQLQSLGCFLAPTSFFKQLRSTISPLTETGQTSLETGGTDSGIIRCIVWNGAWKVWQRYPLFGSGVETFAYSYYQDRPIEHNYVSEWDFLYNKAHNEALNYLANSGLVGFTTYVILVGAILRQSLLLYVDKKADFSSRVLAASIGVSTIGLGVTNFFGFSTVAVTLMQFVLAAILHSLTVTHKAISTENSSIAELKGWQYFALAGTALFTIWGVTTIWAWWQTDYLFSRGKSYLANGYTLDGLTLLEQAVQRRPAESTFTDELAASYAQIAAGLHAQGEASAAAEFAHSAMEMSAYTLMLNPRHLNWYKSRASSLITLSTLQPESLDEAIATLRTAQQLAPTDPKIRYNLGLLYASQNATPAAQAEFTASLELRPNYTQAEEALRDVSASSATP